MKQPKQKILNTGKFLALIQNAKIPDARRIPVPIRMAPWCVMATRMSSSRCARLAKVFAGNAVVLCLSGRWKRPIGVGLLTPLFPTGGQLRNLRKRSSGGVGGTQHDVQARIMVGSQKFQVRAPQRSEPFLTLPTVHFPQQKQRTISGITLFCRAGIDNFQQACPQIIQG